MNTAGTRSKKLPGGDDADGFPRPFGNYILLMPFARGGMGEVYLAKRGAILGAEKYCVLKKLRPELTEDREYVARFIDEARVVVQLNHANICQVFDVGRVGSEYYLAMEYVSGRDLRSLQDRARNLGVKLHEASVLYLLAETLSALDYAHRRTHPMTGEPLNLVHRDVSPQNVMVSFEGEVKLIDFGLASSRLKVERTQPNIVMGKMAYMAPEQARGDAIDRRADLFAAGVIGYELLAGERFYEGMTAQEIWYVVGRGGFVPARWGDLNPDLARILARALHPDPDSRFSTCAELRDAVMAYLHTKHPGLGERSLRELIHELYAEEIQRERDMLLGFAEVSGEIAEDLIEATRSQSVSLAHAGELPHSTGGGARVVHDERTVAADAQSPAATTDAPETQLSPSASATDTGSEEAPSSELPDLKTQLDPADATPPPPPEPKRTPPTGTITSALAEEAKPSRPEPPQPSRPSLSESVEETAVIVRAPAAPATRTMAIPLPEGRGRTQLVMAAAALVLLVGAGVLILGGDDGDGDQRAAPKAAATSPTALTVDSAVAPVERPRPPEESPTRAGRPGDEASASASALPDEGSETRPTMTNAPASPPTPAEQPAPVPDVGPSDERGGAATLASASVSDDEAAQKRTAEARPTRETRRVSTTKPKEERETTRRASTERAPREKDARRAQSSAVSPAPAPAPQESIGQMVYAIVKCDLEPPCAKAGFVDGILKYKAGSMSANDRRSFEQLVRQCRKRCSR